MERQARITDMISIYNLIFNTINTGTPIFNLQFFSYDLSTEEFLSLFPLVSGNSRNGEINRFFLNQPGQTRDICIEFTTPGKVQVYCMQGPSSIGCQDFSIANTDGIVSFVNSFVV